MKKHKLLIAVGLALVLFFAGHAAQFYSIGFVSLIENKLYDTRLRLTLPNQGDERIVILDIDEKSLKEQGRWPWGRDKVAKLIDQLFDHYGVAVVGFDVVFAEADNSSGLKVLQELANNQLKSVPQFQSALAQLKPSLEYDQLLANKMQQRNIVLGYYFNGSNDTSGVLPPAIFPAATFKNHPVKMLHWEGYGANLAQLQASAASAGHFNSLTDRDGVVRRVPMIVEYGGAYYEALSLAMVRAVLGFPKLSPGYAADGNLEWLNLHFPEGVATIPVDASLSALVPYRGAKSTFTYLSVVDVLTGRTPLDALKNKIVLVGTSAPGLLDLRSTPVDEAYPGVEIHANLISGILNHTLKSSPAWVVILEVLLILLVGGVLSVILPLLSPSKVTLVSLVAWVATVAINSVFWQFAQLSIPFATGLLLIFSLFALNMSYGYFVESRTKRQITQLFGQYVPKEVVGELSERPEQVSMEGHSLEMSILFSDVRGFTTISEGLDPKELSLLMNEFLTPLSTVVYKHRGTIDKYMGDCVMAFWGAPLPDNRHAYNAIVAGLEMLQALELLQPHFNSRGWPPIKIGVGVNTGKVSVGNMGSEVRVAYTVMGDAVNLASRLEGITKEYGVGMVVGEQTKAQAPEFIYRELDLVRVKGKEQPVAIFEPIALQGQVSAVRLAQLAQFAQVLAAYRNQQWEQANAQLIELQIADPKATLYQVYLERIAYFQQHPPGVEWDGVFVFKAK